jgi:hypothetical protein
MKYSQELKKSGISTEIVEIDGRFAVCASGRFDSPGEAKAALDRYVQKYGSRYGKAEVKAKP